MIEEIIKLREDGLSFRKIASQLNTTVGKVQYRWNKYITAQEDEIEDLAAASEEQKESSVSKQETIEEGPLKGELSIKLVSPRKVIVYWEASKIPEKVFTLFFNQQFEELVHIVRLYDVTDINFTGNNAHHYYDIVVPYEKGYWFVKGLTASRSYVAELGVRMNDKEFFPILRSSAIQTANMGGTEVYNQLVLNQHLEHYSPKWIDHVSTYSYYEESKKLEQKNG
ncbi:DUF4912 domain-containing protein [Neobacillus vireti]|uniref:DUF4912 domain-containing protein n=1 Tax=Neobacillus vireti TaxID=220686 RepID=UPI003000D753